MQRDNGPGVSVASRIVQMEEKHLQALARLEALCFSEPWSKEGLRAELQNHTACFLVAECENEVAGYAGMHGVCGEGYIANIAVFPAWRGKGVGRFLLKGLIAHAIENDFSFLSLEVRAGNLPAIALYESEGFGVAGVRKGFYSRPREDGVIMTLSF